jgi:hypothetical protein
MRRRGVEKKSCVVSFAASARSVSVVSLRAFFNSSLSEFLHSRFRANATLSRLVGGLA